MTIHSSAPVDGAPPGIPPIEHLQADNYVCEIVPTIGGSLAAFYSPATQGSPRRDWLRPADERALRGGSPLDMASFPLVPWCNRIRNGRFEWHGRVVELGANRPGSPHAIHGIGWLKPWQVVARQAHAIELVYEEPGTGAWPFPFEARQRYALDANGLEVDLSVRNTGAETMPAGIGHHPYFSHRREGAGTRVQAEVEAMWLGDAEVMPTALSRTDPAVAALREGMLLRDFDLDNNYTGFGREARIRWPDGSGLALAGSSPLDFFVLYCPAQHDHFVIEAVSNCTDWINLRGQVPPAHIGGTALEPGATLRATTRFIPSHR